MILSKISIRNFVCLTLLFVSSGAMAQSLTSSPYSKYGLGELGGQNLPQLRAMGGISTGIRSLGSYYNINTENPASYSSIRLMAIDIGVYGNFSTQQRENIKQSNKNFSLGYLSFAVPVSQKSALSFGFKPYSSVGYRYSAPGTIDTMNINSVYSGEGGLTKAYFGYGQQIGEHFSIGANAGYIFGKIEENQEAQYPLNSGALNSKIENSRAINGFSLDYGIQYFTNINDDYGLVIGYSGNSGHSLRSKATQSATRTFGNETDIEDNIALDTISYKEFARQDIIMPLEHKVGFSFRKHNSWLIGGDFHYGKWSDFQEGDVAGNFEDRYGFAIGGSLTPDYTSNRYFSLVDYRLGFRYDKTQLRINEQDINDMAITVGLGLPLPSNRQSTFYKINLSAEFGQRGTLSSNLVKENYITLRLGFTLNDRWFQRYKYD